MNKKSSKNFKLISILDLIIVLLSVTIINYFIYNHYVRLDLTKNRLYTISQGTKNILNNLQDKVNINVYFSKDLPSQMSAISRDVHDMLDEFVASSKGKVVVRFIDPESDQATENKVRSLGIPKIQMNVFNKEKAEIKNGYIGLAVIYEDKHEVIPVVQDIENFEYDLTMAIKKVQQKEKIKIGYMNLDGSPYLDTRPQMYGQRTDKSEIDIFKSALEKNYEIKTISSNSKELIDRDVKCLIVNSPRKLSKRDMFVIDQYVLNGGNLLVFDNSFMRQGLMARDKSSNINQILGEYGVNVDNGAVADAYCKRAAFGGGMYQVITEYPFFVSVQPHNLNRDIPVVSKLQTITLPWASPLKLIKKDSVKCTVLAYSSDHSTIQNGYINLNPQQDINFDKDSIPLVVLSSGKFKSIFDKYVPFDSTDKSNIEPLKESKKAGTVLVVGSSEIINNGLLQRFQENIPFVLNAVDYMCQDRALISIRSKKVVMSPLKDVSSNIKMLIKVLNIGLVPLILILFGIFYNKKRKKGINL